MEPEDNVVLDTPTADEPVDTGEVETPADDQSVETPAENEPILGKFKSVDDLTKSYQELESKLGTVGNQLNDPNFIYSQAVKLGLADAPAEDSASGVQAPPPPPVETVVQQQVKVALDYEKALQELPDLATDDTLRAWAGALVANQGKSHLEAAQIIKATLSKQNDAARSEGITQAKNEISDKERAQTTPQVAKDNSDVLYEQDLQKRMKSLDRKTQQKAYVEWLARQK